VCAVAGAGIWWFALRDGTSTFTDLLIFVLLIGAAVVSGFKALPAGFVRWDDAAWINCRHKGADQAVSARP
jgi:hypothetical protein